MKVSPTFANVDVRSLVARAAASGGDIGKVEAIGVHPNRPIREADIGPLLARDPSQSIVFVLGVESPHALDVQIGRLAGGMGCLFFVPEQSFARDVQRVRAAQNRIFLFGL